MNNVVLRTIPLAAAFQPLSAKKVEVAWIPGEYHIFWRVNLGEIRVRGAPGDVLTLVGGTW